MGAGINNVIYMELHSGPKMANGTCGKTIVAGTIDRHSTVILLPFNLLNFNIYCSLVLIYSAEVSLFFKIIHGSLQY